MRLLLNLSHGKRPEYDDALARLAADGVIPKTARSADLLDHLANAQGSDVLIVYWIGHGILRNERRMALTADSRDAAHLHALDLSSLLTHTRSALFAPLQFGFIDCCAQVIQTQPTVTQLSGDGVVSREQHFFFASSASETTSTAVLPNQGFTNCVLQTFEHVAWPPEALGLQDELMQKLRSDGSRKWISDLHWTTGSGDLFSRQRNAGDAELVRQHAQLAGLSVAALALLSREAGQSVSLEELSTALRNRQMEALIQRQRGQPSGAGSASALSDAFRSVQIVRRFLPVAERLMLNWQKWLALGEDVLRREGQELSIDPGTLEALMLRISDTSDRERSLASLARLLVGAASMVHEAQAQPRDELLALLHKSRLLRPWVRQAREERRPPDAPVLLQVSMRLDVAGEFAIIDDAWLEDVERETLDVPEPSRRFAKQLNELVQNVGQRYPSRPLVIELLAPSELLCAPREWLEFRNELLDVSISLDKEWPVVVRWRDRLVPGLAADCQAAQWKRRHSALLEQLRAGSPMGCVFRPSTADSVVVGLTFPGPTPADRGRNRARFFSELMAGHPFMCWPREPVANADEFASAASDLIHSSTLIGLPAALKDAKAGGHPTLTDMVLLMDVPERNPFET
ncbi:hypothetical protein ACSFA8_22555 [Variovorax sp. RT4R15]|uniref:hypothetical protein n=1 Tax=Variovorax sp. RT4R15 TaxID=3443737 RepID=UPI003F478D95